MDTKQIKLKSGITIYTRIAGDPSRPPVVLLHGWPSSSLLWRNIIPDLSHDFHVLAPDLPGHGQSDKPLDVDYNLAFLRRFILDFTDATGLDKITLVAHDLGGMAGLSFAARHPERLDTFVIMNTCPYADVSLRFRLSIFALSRPLLSRFFLHPFAFKQVLKTGIHQHHLITPDLLASFRSHWMMDKDSIRSFAHTIAVPVSRMVEPVETLREIKCPTLILWGKKDRFFPFRLARRLHQDLDNSQLLGIENTAHFCQEEAPGFVTRAIASFLNEKTKEQHPDAA